MIEIYIVIMILGLVLLIIFAALGGFGGDADFDVDGDMDFDIDMDHDIDFGDGGHDIDIGDVDGHDIDIGDADGHDVDLGDVDGHDGITHMSPVSLPNILVFMTSFGAFGTIFEGIGWNGILIPVLSAIISIIIATIMFFVMERVFAMTESTSVVQMHKLVGLEAKISIAIKKGKEGQIEVIKPEGGVMLMGALADEHIPKNTIVVIDAIKGDVAKVRKAGKAKKKERSQQAVMKMQKKGKGSKSVKKGAKRKKK